MALSIKDDDTDRVVRRYAAMKGLSYTKAVHLAVSDAIAREDSAGGTFNARVKRMQERIAKHPRNDRTAEEILGYDEHGLPR
jgi:antitoxin VapB